MIESPARPALPPELEALFQRAIQPPEDPTRPPADIWEHLELLRSLASQVNRVTEFGVRGGCGSTLAFLAGQPDSLISWDIDPRAIVCQGIADLVGFAGRTRFQPRTGDTLSIPVIEETDLLFIDSYHTARQLVRELERHADPIRKTVKRFLVFHDTVTFGHVGEDGSVPGLRTAIHQFQTKMAFSVWALREDRKNCNGLVVLEHV